MKRLNEKFGQIQLNEWNGQNSLWFEIGEQNVWVDPYNLPDRDYAPVDIILITHDHFDHLSQQDLTKVADIKKTKIYTPSSCIKSVEAFFGGEILAFDIGDIIEIESVFCRACPAYGIRNARLHPKEKGWISLLFDDGDTKIFITSDTERIPEFKEIQTDVIFLPLGQRFTFGSLQEAVDVALDVKAKVAVPVHYGMNEGSVDDIDKFREMVRTNEIEVLAIPQVGRMTKIPEDQLIGL